MFFFTKGKERKRVYIIYIRARTKGAGREGTKTQRRGKEGPPTVSGVCFLAEEQKDRAGGAA